MAKSTRKADNNTAVSSVEKYLNSKYDFRHNPILERTEFKTKKSKTYQLLSERHVNSICRELNNSERKCTITALRSLLNSDFVREENPFINYFEGLPKWNGKTDYIGQLAATVTAENHDFWTWAFKKWLVNLVSCAMGKSINQQVLVFVGKQGIGKTTWLNKLVPAPLEGYLYSGTINPSNKDTLVNLSENIIINLDELENLNKSELGSLKSLITQSAIRLRKAYGIFNENYVRRASFVGSVNEVEFLTDTTGNRRYLVIDTVSIEYKHKVDIDLVYSQAYSLLKSDFHFVFDHKDIDRIDENNQKFTYQSTEEELLLKHYRHPQEGDTNILTLTTTDILMELQNQTKLKLGDPSSIKRLGNALQKHKFQRISKNNAKPYQLVSIVQEQKQEDTIEPVQIENIEEQVNNTVEYEGTLPVKVDDLHFEIIFILRRSEGNDTVEFIEDEAFANYKNAFIADARDKFTAANKEITDGFEDKIIKGYKDYLTKIILQDYTS